MFFDFVIDTFRSNSKVQFSVLVIGCPDLLAPKGGWVERDAEKSKVGCHGSDDVYILTCSGTTWQGQYSNCTNGIDIEAVNNKTKDILPRGKLSYA